MRWKGIVCGKHVISKEGAVENDVKYRWKLTEIDFVLVGGNNGKRLKDVKAIFWKL